MAPRKADDCQMNKRVAAAGCRLPVTLPVGKILTDITQKDWILGPRLGSGGFGDIYLGYYQLFISKTPSNILNKQKIDILIIFFF